MPKHGKKYEDAAKEISRETLYDPQEAFALIKKTATAKFDETVELAVRLNLDPRQADQQVRGAVVLPNGTGPHPFGFGIRQRGKSQRSRSCRRDFVGAEDMVRKNPERKLV